MAVLFGQLGPPIWIIMKFYEDIHGHQRIKPYVFGGDPLTNYCHQHVKCMFEEMAQILCAGINSAQIKYPNNFSSGTPVRFTFVFSNYQILQILVETFMSFDPLIFHLVYS